MFRQDARRGPAVHGERWLAGLDGLYLRRRNVQLSIRVLHIYFLRSNGRKSDSG